MVQSRSREKIQLQVTYRFPRAKEDISDELGASRRERPADGLVLGGVCASSIGVDVLEDLVETELAEALEGVADKRRQESNAEALDALRSVNLLEAFADTGVQSRASLNEAVSNRSEQGPLHH